MTKTTGLTKNLAGFCDAFDFSHLSETAKDRVKASLLDALGCVLLGSTSDATKILCQALELTPEGDVSIAGTRLRSDRRTSALVHGVAAHADELDDYDVRAGGHPAAVIVPAALASFGPQASGRDLLCAIALGYEVMIHLGSVLFKDSYGRGFHATGNFGAIAAAAVCAKLMGLNGSQTISSLGLAASQGAGIRSQFGSMAKPFQAGHAAMAGVVAAQLGLANFTTTPDPLGAPGGWVQLIVGDEDRDGVVENLELNSKQLGGYLESAPPSLKPHASCGSAHSATDAAIELRDQMGVEAVHRIEKIHVELPTATLQSLFHHRPRTSLEAKFSVEFSVAVGLIYGDATIGRFDQPTVTNRDVTSLVDRVIVTGSPELQELREQEGSLPASLEVVVEDRVYKALVRFPRGSSQWPLTPEDVTQKFLTNSEGVLPRSQAIKVSEVIHSLEATDRVLDTLIPLLIPST